MAAGWVAGSVRARALARRRLGRGGARALVGSGSLESALESLANSSYGRDVRPDQSLAEAQRAVGATLLWHLRVLAGWLPADGVRAVRALAGWFEIANVDDLFLAFSGKPRPRPFQLGRLAVAWPRLAPAGSAEQVREVLASSAWGDPGGETPWLVGLTMRCAWAERAAEVSDAIRRLAAGGTALLLARERYDAGRTLPEPAARSVTRLLGTAWIQAATLADVARTLPPVAGWALAGITSPDDLWRGEARWWTRLERDGFALLRRPRFHHDVAVGAIALLAADAWRVAAALELAARRGPVEILDALA